MADQEDSPRVYSVIHHPAAERDLEAIFDRVRRDIGPASAQRYLRKMRDELEGLSLFPHRGRDRSRGEMQLRLIPNWDRRYVYVIRIYESERVVQVGYVWGGGTEPLVDRLKDET